MPTDNTTRLRELQPGIKPFEFRFRPVGWAPDLVDSGTGTLESIFPEEAIGTVDKTRVPFAIPAHNGKAFEEPKPGDSATLWHSFDRWILGYPLNKPTGADSTAFFQFVTDLCNNCREYNASLYRMRRLHFELTKEVTLPSMPGNPSDGLLDPLPDPHTAKQDFANLVGAAEANWSDVTLALQKKLEAGYQDGGRQIRVLADMVEINGYIVSIRTLAEITNPSGAEEEFTGISSSHTSLSSGFSSGPY